MFRVPCWWDSAAGRFCKDCRMSCRVLNRGDIPTSRDKSWSLRQGAVLCRWTGEDRSSVSHPDTAWTFNQHLFRCVAYLVLLWSYSLMKTVDTILKNRIILLIIPRYAISFFLFFKCIYLFYIFYLFNLIYLFNLFYLLYLLYLFYLFYFIHSIVFIYFIYSIYF